MGELEVSIKVKRANPSTGPRPASESAIPEDYVDVIEAQRRSGKSRPTLNRRFREGLIQKIMYPVPGRKPAPAFRRDEMERLAGRIKPDHPQVFSATRSNLKRTEHQLTPAQSDTIRKAIGRRDEWGRFIEYFVEHVQREAGLPESVDSWTVDLDAKGGPVMVGHVRAPKD